MNLFMDFVTNLPVLDTEHVADQRRMITMLLSCVLVRATGTNKDASAARFRSKYKGKEDKKK
jgi:hypothetical protein